MTETGPEQWLAERVGSGRARELVMTGDLYDTQTLPFVGCGQCDPRRRSG